TCTRPDAKSSPDPQAQAMPTRRRPARCADDLGPIVGERDIRPESAWERGAAPAAATLAPRVAAQRSRRSDGDEAKRPAAKRPSGSGGRATLPSRSRGRVTLPPTRAARASAHRPPPHHPVLLLQPPHPLLDPLRRRLTLQVVPEPLQDARLVVPLVRLLRQPVVLALVDEHHH